MKKALIIAALLIAICATFAFSACLYPGSLHKIDYDGMDLIFEDNFDTFDTSVWHSEDDGVRRGGYWDENGYEFYVNGERTRKTSFEPTTAAQYLWLSVEISGEMTGADPANPDNVYTWGEEITSNPEGQDFVSEFVIDYVKCYKVK